VAPPQRCSSGAAAGSELYPALGYLSPTYLAPWVLIIPRQSPVFYTADLSQRQSVQHRNSTKKNIPRPADTQIDDIASKHEQFPPAQWH